MDLSTWDFDPYLLGQASLSKHVAYESVDRFVAHTWMCQNVFLSISQARCSKNIKLFLPLYVFHFLYYIYGWNLQISQPAVIFGKGGRL